MRKVIVQGPMAPLTIGFIDADIPELSVQKDSKVITQVSPKAGTLPAVEYDNVNSRSALDIEESPDSSFDLTHHISEEIRPIRGGLIAVCIFVALFCGFVAVAVVLITGIGLLHALAVYFAVGNAIVLSAAVIMSHLCRESYDME